MNQYTPEQVAEIQSRWAKQQSNGQFWFVILLITLPVIMIPRTNAWLSDLIAPVPLMALWMPLFFGIAWIANRSSRCPGCQVWIQTRMRTRNENYCPACGVMLRQPPQ